MKTKVRVSFILDLDAINRDRKLNGHAPWDDKTFFSFCGGAAIVTLTNDKHQSEIISVPKLSYIVS